MRQPPPSDTNPWLDVSSSAERHPQVPKSSATSVRAERAAGPWSFRLTTMFGIDIKVHATFLMFLVWIAGSHLAQGHDFALTAEGVGLTLAVFGTVVLHELGHALTARRFGIRTRDITLLPIGGIAKLERLPEKPTQELLVALAGPAVNFALALAFAGLIVATRGRPQVDLQLVGGPLLPKLMWMNVSLGTFNLLPALPMDGGRVLRSALALRTDRLRATRIAASVSRALAFLLAWVGLLANPMLLLIAFFVWVGGAQEVALVQAQSALEGMLVRDAMRTEFATLAAASPLAEAVKLIVETSQHDFPVVQGQRLIGVLNRADVIQGLAQHGPTVPVERIMRRDYATAAATDPLEPAIAGLGQSQQAPILVVQDGRLIGLLGPDSVSELEAVQSVLRDQRSSHRG